MWKILHDKNGNYIRNNILNLKNTLLNGQSFNWKITESSSEKLHEPNHRIEYIGYIEKKVFLLKEDFIFPKSDVLSDSNKSIEDYQFTENNQFNINAEEKYIFYKLLNTNETTNENKNKNISNIKYENKTNSGFQERHSANTAKKELIVLDKSSIKKTKQNKEENSSLKTLNSTLMSSHLNSIKNKEYLEEQNINDLILDYFQMEVDLHKILLDITPKLPNHFNNVIQNLEGVRIIKQDVFECTISFICSSNNNIERIRKMLLALRENYGELILDDKTYGKIYAFPTLKDLIQKTSEEKLRNMGFGYRAKYIVESLKYINEKGIDWLYNLENMENPWTELINLTGVGRKVADCISLFSLKKHNIVPLDIHMIKFYNETVVKLNKDFKKIDNLTNKVYEDVSKIYSNTFGLYAGWVHSVFYLNRVDKSKPDFLKENNTKKLNEKIKGKVKAENLIKENTMVKKNAKKTKKN